MSPENGRPRENHEPPAPDDETRDRAHEAPDEKHDPDSPTDLTKRSWTYVLRKTVREFGKDQCTDIAAALTFFAVLAMFPALIALLSIIGLVGESQQTVDTLVGILETLGGGSVADTLEPVLNDLANSGSAGVALIAGLAAALWSASAYTSAFARAMNRIYQVDEGRPFWKFRPLMILLTAVLLLMAAVVLIGLVLSGPVAQAVGDSIGLSSTVMSVWSIAKWPVILLVVAIMVALLYWATPNLKQPKFRWLSIGAATAILVWILASAGFGFYIANFSNYEQTYGALAGVIVFLLWVWLTNVALLFGAELDAELERGRELQSGIAAEERIQLPPRDTKKSEKDAKKRQQDVDDGRAIRLAHGKEDAEDSSGATDRTPEKER
ncbi:YihY/virulence factor BrkB family protein [Demequina sp. SO4-13]|uniref:YihY/virulence factor BrkB family protein n=1 Tax=Demequina sp. SO4-13 TaxID=3401027 RepID=UPI003AF99B00